MGARVGPNTGLSQIGSRILRSINDEIKIRHDVKSTEEMLEKIESFNKSLMARKSKKKFIAASLDIKNFYPSIDANRGAKIAKLMWNRSKIDVENLNIEELVWYVSKYGLKENIEEEGLSDYLYTKKMRKVKKKVGIKKKGLKVAKGVDTLARPKMKIKKNEKSNWDKPKKYPNQHILRKLVGSALEILILTVFGSHMYQFNGQFRLQLDGGATGLELTGELADLIMLWWDEEFLNQLKNLSVEVGLYTRFKDDICVFVEALSEEVRYSEEYKEFIYESNTFGQIFLKYKGQSFQKIYEQRRKSMNERNTMETICNVANHIEPMIQLTYDIPMSYPDSKLPVLDIKLWLDPSGEAMYEFYEKVTKNDKVILASSAIPRNQKITILTAEAVRRLRNTSRKLGSSIQNKHLNDFTVKLKDSGYSAKDRKEIIVNANKIFQLQCERDEKGIKPLFRPREMILTDRKTKKGQKHSWWKVKDKYNAVMFVPPTPGGVLLKMLRARAENISADPDLKIRFIEQGSVKIKNLLVKQIYSLQLTALVPFVPSAKRQVHPNQGANPFLELLAQLRGLGT